MDCSIIIVNYNTFELTKNAIESIFNKTVLLKYEVLLVDNASPDNSGSQLKEYFGNSITFIQSNSNIGFGRANNLGINMAKGRNILFLNSDTLLINNAIKILSDSLDNNSETGICCGNLYTVDLAPTVSHFFIYYSLMYELNNLSFGLIARLKYGRNRYFNHSNNNIEVGHVLGADMMIKREVLNKTGAFDPDFFMYCEETDLNYRVKKAGYKTYNIPEAKIIHFEAQSSRIGAERQIRWDNSKKIYYKKREQNKIGYQIVLFFMKLNYLEKIVYNFLTRNKLMCRICIDSYRHI